jgi:hypothetical protein
MASLRETAVGRCTMWSMLSPDYWNAGTSLSFGARFRPSASTRCSPATSSCTSSWYNITSKLYLVRRRDKVQRVWVFPTFRKSSPRSKLLQMQYSTIWWRTHAHGMVGLLLGSFIAQQCLMLASFSLTVLFIVRAEPRATGEVMTLSPRGPGTGRHVHN